MMWWSRLGYDIGLALYFIVARCMALAGNAKAKKFVFGRKGVIDNLEKQLIHRHGKRIWMHIASLGEYEQAKPVIQALRDKYPDAVILLSFFSPSGYEPVSKQAVADIVFYLPRDTARNARKLLQVIRPSMLLFVKYDLWYHLVTQAKQRQVSIILFSAVYRASHSSFLWYGALYRDMLRKMTYIFVQDKASKELLKSIPIQSIVAGDTRVDSVLSGVGAAADLSKVAAFVGNNKVLVVGSAWEEELAKMILILPQLLVHYRIIIAPHRIDASFVNKIMKQLEAYNPIRYHDIAFLDAHPIMILNTIGMLKHVYSLGSVAVVGGGFRKSGIHSILEPAAYGLPIFFGPNNEKFNEATDLIEKGGAKVFEHQEELLAYLTNEDVLANMSQATSAYIQDMQGATDIIMAYL